jgi:prophage regulatory protein
MYRPPGENMEIVENGILRAAEVREAVGLSAKTIRRLEREGRFPKRRRLSAKAVGWVKSEIQEWIASRATTLQGAPGRTK